MSKAPARVSPRVSPRSANAVEPFTVLVKMGEGGDVLLYGPFFTYEAAETFHTKSIHKDRPCEILRLFGAWRAVEPRPIVSGSRP